MPMMIINGGNKLSGSVNISGAKNSVLPLLAASVLCDGETVLYNCPDIADVETSIQILNVLGIEASFKDNTVYINGRIPSNTTISENMMRKMRSSIIFSGCLLARRGKAIVSTPGGCELGPRPIDIHIEALKVLGVNYSEDHGRLHFTAEDGLTGGEINLKIQSVGATQTSILAAVLAKGTTVIHNAAREPEIGDLITFLNKAGADIRGMGSSTIVINGVSSLKGVPYYVMPDRIEAATFISAVASASGEITLNGAKAEHIESIIDVFKTAGCDFKIKENAIKVTAPKNLSAVPFIKSMPYPAFPTDAGPVVTAALASASGSSVFCEGIFENRFRYISELVRMGADIKTEGRVAVINGKPLYGAHCRCYDLRGGAAIAVAALAAKGTTYISNIRYINRGYENFTEKLSTLGADVYIKE